MGKAVFMVFIMPFLSCASNDVKIIEYDNPQKALLVVDMQVDYIGINAKFPLDLFDNPRSDNMKEWDGEKRSWIQRI